MKTLRTIVIAWLALGASLSAQPPAGAPKGGAPKAPPDPAVEEFVKTRDEAATKPDDARFKKLIATGIAFLQQNPTHSRATAVVNTLAEFGGPGADPKLAAFRGNFLGLLKFAIIDERDKDGLSPEARTAMAALEAATQDAETRIAVSKDNIDTLREKIDRLTPMPGAGRFLIDRERSYVEILMRGVNPTVGERHLKKLIAHPDKGVATWAQTDLNIVEVRKAPYALKFTALDGKECDVGTMRGKAVALVFFTTANEASVKSLVALKDVQSRLKRELQVVAVSFDKAEDRAKLEAVVKDNKLAWPVHFDGKEAKNDWAPKLNVTRAPAIALFDQKGLFLTNAVRADRLEGEVKRLFGIRDEPEPDMGGGGKGGGKRR
jgi:cytochrome oxidase Cu insertion factor (SCO1/SenC/PrrC family)